MLTWYRSGAGGDKADDEEADGAHHQYHIRRRPHGKRRPGVEYRLYCSAAFTALSLVPPLHRQFVPGHGMVEQELVNAHHQATSKGGRREGALTVHGGLFATGITACCTPYAIRNS